MKPLKVVCIGGGTGLSTLLRGIKQYVASSGRDRRTFDMDWLTAIVAVSDDGGSSGRLIDEFGVLPPGDIRNCLVALANEDEMMSQLFEYRFDSEGDLQGALSLLLSISKSHPRDTAVHNNLATVYMQLGQLDKANEILVKSIRRASDYAPTHLTMAMVLQRQGDPARAIVYAKRAVELQPAMSAAHALLGRLALQQGDLVASSAYFEESLSIGNSDPSTSSCSTMDAI